MNRLSLVEYLQQCLAQLIMQFNEYTADIVE